MSYNPDEHVLMAYLYGELEGEEKVKFEQYLLDNPPMMAKYESMKKTRALLGMVEDKEVIAPPVFLQGKKQSLWEAPYVKTVMSIAASVIIVMLVAKLANVNMAFSDSEFRMSFGTPAPKAIPPAVAPALTQDQVQQLIDHAVAQNNSHLTSAWSTSQDALASSIKKNMMLNEGKINQLMQQASAASKDQVQQYVSSLQADNLQLVKDYLKLNSTEQKQYIETLLVDFAKYLQQQRNDDFQLVQLRLNKLEQNTNVFQQETEQILTSIISSVNNTGERKY